MIKVIFLIFFTTFKLYASHVDVNRFLTDCDKDDYFYCHKLRYYETINFINNNIRVSEKSSILELGAPSVVLDYFHRAKGSVVDSYSNELRESIEKPSSTYDMILMLEVFEHIKDIDAKSHNATYCFSGCEHVLTESHRMLKTGGALILTTPNASSLTVLANFLKGLPPYNYSPHPREYTKDEVISLASKFGFNLLCSQVIDVWNLPHGYTKEILSCGISALLQERDSIERGDDMMFIFIKD